MVKFKFFVPTKIFFGRGQLNEMHKRGLPGKKALIVISSGKSVRVNGYLARVEEQLDRAGIEHVIYDKVKTNPRSVDIEEGARFARENGCDVIVGLGDGSSIDTAKLIALLAANEGSLWDYAIGGTGKRTMAKNKALPIIAIPTTAGTGTEADQWGVATNEQNEKIGMGNEDTFPTIAIVDPDLMMSVPPKLTAYQGFDALFHATEGYISTYSNFNSQIYSLKSIEYIAKGLAAAVADGSNAQAREDVALGSTLAGIVEALTLLAGNHGLEHALSAYHPDLPHGAGLIMMSVAYYKLLADLGACDEKMINMAKAMGVKDASKAMDFVDALAKLIEDCGVADLKMSDYGITPDRFEEYVDNAFKTNIYTLNADPAKITKEQRIQILKDSYK
ncbi:MAG: iron-containing alcohol dehydrogenase [Clostridia bacterium]|nr:iron-containing alcohol dehydrogenase [Clostridia bacterium]